MKTLILGRLITLFVLMFGLILPTTYVAAADISLSTFQKFTGQGDDLSGYSVASAGDVNGDGYNDFLVGAYGNDSSTGAVYLIYGTDSILTSADLSTAVKFTGESPNDFAGYSVASAGDVNGDGYDDILIGAKGDDTIGTNAGAVYLIYGGSRLSSYGGSLSGAVKFTGEKASDNAGFSVASAGDVDGDNIDDILIGAPYSNSLLHTGAAYVIYGKPIHLTSANLSTAVKFSGTLLNDNAGFSVAGAGDVDGDNIDDILIGSPYNGFSDAGAAYLVYGQTSFTSSKLLLSTLVTASEAVKFTGASPDDSAGYSVASAGDVNNDGNDDILIGAPYNDDAGTDAGAAYLVYGQTSFSGYTLSSDAIEFTGETINDNAGFSVASAGDVNNDNYNDILIGAPLQYFTAGAVYFIYGQEADLSSASLSTSAAMFVGQESGDSAGNSVASAGDVNGDGYADILIGAPYALSDTTGADAGAAYLGYLYVDLDGDGLTGSSILTSGTDTNDNDFDNDGSEIGTDCDDGDASISANQTYYKDNDNDGLGDPATSTSICSYTVPTGYVTNSSDTNDNDYDNDGSVTGTDCNDADSTISTNQTYYKDNDNDGLGDPAN
ncbi:MAG: integrin alpha, partial [Patescibacteria group bacterium]